MAGGVAVLSSLLLICAMLGATVSGDVSFQKFMLQVGVGNIYNNPDTLSDVNINLTAIAADSSSSQDGTSNWNMTVFASKQNDPSSMADALSVQPEVLSQTQQDAAVQPGETLEFLVTVQFPVGEMGGCDGDYKYFCVVFGKSDEAQPDFTLSHNYSGCVEFQFSCANDPQPTAAAIPDEDKSVVFSNASSWLNWGYSPDAGDEKLNFNVTFDPSSRQNLEGSGLWKLGVFWRNDSNANSSGDNYAKQDQILSSEESSLSLVNGQSLKFEVDVDFPQPDIGCGEGQYRYLCVEFTKGGNPEPNYDLANSLTTCSMIVGNCDEE